MLGTPIVGIDIEFVESVMVDRKLVGTTVVVTMLAGCEAGIIMVVAAATDDKVAEARVAVNGKVVATVVGDMVVEEIVVAVNVVTGVQDSATPPGHDHEATS